MGFLTDLYEAEIDAAAIRRLIPENFLEATILQESLGDWSASDSPSDPNYVRYDIRPGNPMYPFVGIFKTAAESWGCQEFGSMAGNRQAQIDCMATIQRGWMDQLQRSPGSYGIVGRSPDWLDVGTVYFGGPGALTGSFTDEFGTTSGVYRENLASKWQALDTSEGIKTFGKQSGVYDRTDCIYACLDALPNGDERGVAYCQDQCPKDEGGGGLLGYIGDKFNAGVAIASDISNWFTKLAARAGLLLIGIVLVALGIYLVAK